MRISSPAYHCLLVVAFVSVTQQKAYAQGFFQQLFGIGQPSAEPPPPSLRSFGRISPYGSGRYRSYRHDQSYGSYRTLCVRACDGFYWPISANTTRDKLDQDADICESNCTSKARLFYLPHKSNDIENMTDLSGRTYGELRTAFAYRKKLVAGCTCKPMPWAKSEKARHDHYALVEKLEQQRNAATASKTPDTASEGSQHIAGTEHAPDPLTEPELPVEVSSTNRPVMFGPPQDEDGMRAEMGIQGEAIADRGFTTRKRVVIRKRPVRKRKPVKSARAARAYVPPIGGLRAWP